MLRYGLLEEEWPRKELCVCAAHVKLVPFATKYTQLGLSFMSVFRIQVT